MSAERSHAAIANVSGKIFVMGGKITNEALSSLVESYDPIKNEWTTLAPMIEKRAGARAAVIRGNLYVLGGYNGSCCLSTIEHYNQQSNKWTIVSSSPQNYSAASLN